jgi:DNA-binding LacI/PurR family transcriptional regulator
MKPKADNGRRRRTGAAALPFEVDRRKPGRLVDQFADGLRQAILSNFWKPGEALPTLDRLAAAAGTSLRIPREAVARLKAEGLVDPRPGLGCMVTGARRSRWRGHVLFVLHDAEGSYYADVFAGVLQERFVRAGYLFTRVSASARAGADRGALDAALSQNVTLAVLFCGGSLRTARLLDARGVPFVEIGRAPSRLPAAKGFVRFDREAALADFAAHCAERGARRVLQVCFRGGEGDADAGPALAAAGVAIRRLAFPAPPGPGRIEAIQRLALEGFAERLASGWRPAEDVLLFTDDFLASGALPALSAAGLRAPEDFRAVSFFNAGFGPVYPRPLTRLEMDPRAHGAAASDLLLGFLAGRPIPPDAAIRSTYRRGETF